MSTTTKPTGRNYASRYQALSDVVRCRWAKNYGLTVCNDLAEFDVTYPGTKTMAASVYGFCSFHAPKAIARHARDTGGNATMKAR